MAVVMAVRLALLGTPEPAQPGVLLEDQLPEPPDQVEVAATSVVAEALVVGEASPPFTALRR